MTRYYKLIVKFVIAMIIAWAFLSLFLGLAMTIDAYRNSLYMRSISHTITHNLKDINYDKVQHRQSDPEGLDTDVK